MLQNQVPLDFNLDNSLLLECCPHCGRANPTITMPNQANWVKFGAHHGEERIWGVYGCTSCGKLIVAVGCAGPGSEVLEIYPAPKSVADEIPGKAREFLRQAYASLCAPAGAVVLCASAVDAMLKEKGYDTGTLNQRIDAAVEANLLTKEMGKWAHHVRLEANDQRHVDKNAGFPTKEQAEQSIEFTEALAEILFVLPSRAKRGIERATASGVITISGSATPRLLPADQQT